ncbi:MAG: 2-hydroxymuconic semialdehyde dehydrogenase [Deltaproteobacteria bacterium]
MDTITCYIGNEPVPFDAGTSFELTSPVDGTKTGKVREATEAEVDAAVRAAKKALQGPWGSMTIAERTKLLSAVIDGINARFEDFVQAEMADTGQPRHLVEKALIPRGAANFEVFADLVKSLSSEAFETDPPVGPALNYTIRRPKGVIGVICPWNAPFLLMTWKVAPALACGNTVVVKPSEQTPRTATLLAEVMAEVGVPPGVYNVVHGFGPGSAGEFLTKSPVDAITFTGETVTGTAIMKAAAEGIRDVSFELGGKNSAVVFADADLDETIEGIYRSAFLNTGQVCLGTERVFVERPIFDEFRDRLVERVKKVRYGRPEDADTNYGPLNSLEHKKKVLSYYAKAVEEGATVVTGGGEPDVGEALAGGAWVEPTIWTDAPADAAILHEEIFGPCCHLTPFDDEAEVVRAVNDTPYGLSASVWTTNLRRGHTVAAGIDVGVVWVNSWFLRDLRTAFGGSKQSGIGREGGVHSLEFYMETKNICLKL